MRPVSAQQPRSRIDRFASADCRMLSLIPLAVLTDRMQNKKPNVMLSAVVGLYVGAGRMLAFLDNARGPFLILLMVLVISRCRSTTLPGRPFSRM
jgi:hypothetical protein